MCFLAGRVSYLFGFKGPAWVTDSACSSSGVAIHYGIASLRNDECSLAICGGANYIGTATRHVETARLGLISRSGRSAPFREQADGYVRSEGAALLVLRRLAKPLGPAWPFQDRHTSPLFDFLAFVVHLFRMPVFFALAGLFGAMLYQRRGLRGFLAHRGRRVLVPFGVAWMVDFPLVTTGFAFALAGGGSAGWQAARGALAKLYERPHTMHLWFLYYLVAFYAVVVALLLGARRLAGWWGRAVRRSGAIASAVLAWRWSFVPLGALTASTLLPMSHAALDNSLSFSPPLRVPLAYLVFFAVGWLLFARLDLLPAFARRCWRFLGGASVLSVVYLAVLLRPPAASARSAHVLGCLLAGLTTWLFIFGAIGFFVRYFDSPRPLQRYLADGSYWMYLLHLPLTIWLPGLLAPRDWPAFVKFGLVLAGTTFTTVVTYHLFVRSTALGAALNGRRHPAPRWRAPVSGERPAVDRSRPGG